MDKNSITGFILIALVLIGFTYFSQPSKEDIAKAKTADSLAIVNAEKEKKAAQLQALKDAQEKERQLADTTAMFSAARHGENQTIRLENKLVSLEVGTLGGCIKNAIIKNYLDQEKKQVELFNETTSTIDFSLPLKEENIRTSECYFVPENVTDSTVTMRLQAKNGASLVFDYKLRADAYMVDFTIHSEGLEKYIMPNVNSLAIAWKDSVKAQEKGYAFESRYSTLTYKEKDDGTDYLNETKEDEETLEETLDWVAFKNQFFSYVLIGYDGFTGAQLKSIPLEKGSGYLKHFDAKMQTAFDPTGKTPTKMQFYIGPNKFRLLQSMDKYSLVEDKHLRLDRLVDLGWPLIRYINRYFTIYVFDWLTRLGISMGIVLLIITLLLRAIVYPATKKSYMSSAKMRVLKPKLDEISKKYPNPEDNMKKQQEIMATYSKYGVSPMGGCLPALIQMPIWIAMFNFVPNAIELRQESFLWADDLSTYDSLVSWNHSLPIIGDHLSLFCLLFCATNLLYSWISMRMQKDSMAGQQADQMKMMQWMMMLMPLFFFFIFNDYSSGLNYYYFISLLAGALSMWWLRWRTDDKKLLEKLEENYRRNMNNPQKMKGLAARLEALQKQQELRQQQLKNRR